ncbi:hypothetical protein SERLA73DRAFT_66806 [Serpula lacrymans var. lacrymans S7.3]|uniref:Pinin/SDK/MemA protein domain-containing protein n=2 Tax=Serpula lacrymans var. lacrymans TaxID=341189 RepID=F8QIR1_SERL3|nr:uncharacterized protein SERLADRAFT_367696 [Serpula lacrymans var. lacrymans S7.9]EGN91809.1 hypothetical protein SERLA73DRAFT_66806 [Serpula lacrymans var. lacrymans S7.3]EGO26065.1 hypothetical protein SERLADRAFT_367696 [Serpula lacrymans var. lacrymans S7.9]
MQEPPTAPAAMAVGNKKRPRIDLNVDRERKRGKSMFGLVLGTLNKAKIEDKERNASDAAKKRQLIEQRLQSKLRKETDSVRRAEEAKKDKTSANRKEEDLQLKDSIHKQRRTRLPLLSNFLLTSDIIPTDDLLSSPSSTNLLSPPPRSHPPPLYYIPAMLTPAQEAFLARRKAEVKEATEKEWESFKEERTTGITEISQLRQRVAEEEARRKSEKDSGKQEEPDKDAMADDKSTEEKSTIDAAMEVDDGSDVVSKETKETVEPERKDDIAPTQADDEDAVEY